jgi:hypothetical protein
MSTVLPVVAPEWIALAAAPEWIERIYGADATAAALPELILTVRRHGSLRAVHRIPGIKAKPARAGGPIQHRAPVRQRLARHCGTS